MLLKLNASNGYVANFKRHFVGECVLNFQKNCSSLVVYSETCNIIAGAKCMNAVNHW